MNIIKNIFIYKRKNIFLDFIYFNIKDNLEECCKYIFDLMNKSIELTNMSNKHSKMIILDKDTEEGFTSVILLDESHITCHAYTKLGLLALDVFTCGNTNPIIISDYLIKEIKIKYPTIKCTNYSVNKRFLYYTFGDLKRRFFIKIKKIDLFKFKVYTYITTKEMNFTNMNIKDFIDYIITFDDVDDILENCKTQSEKGFIFERLFDIVIKFGFCDVLLTLILTI